MKRFLCTLLVCFLLLYAGQARANLVSGTVTTGSVSPGGSVTYYFTATSGQYANLNIYSASYTGNIAVKNPDSTNWSGSGLSRAYGPLTQTGTYTVTVTAQYPSQSGGFSLYFVLGGGSVSGGSLTSGGTISDTLPLNGLMSYQFTGTAGQGIMLQVGASYSMTVSVYNPNGSAFTSSYNTIVATLPTTGTYTVVLEGQYGTSTGPFNLYYVKGDSSVSSGIVNSGLAISDSLPLNGLKSYQFTGTTGQGILLQTGASYSTVISVFNPDGTPVTPNYGRIVLTLAQTGTYTVVVSAQYGTSTGPYTLYYAQGIGRRIGWLPYQHQSSIRNAGFERPEQLPVCRGFR
ncbi:MAG TPA: hypothetical protein VFW40_05950 [Capsulimonadaceae bacterium]|nr:hypothetical protein [Capsulimonadaceae bacterium]